MKKSHLFQYSERRHRAMRVGLFYQIDVIFDNIKRLMKPKYLDLYYPCFLRYIDCLSIFQSIVYNKNNSSILEKIENKIEELYTYMTSSTNILNHDKCVEIVKAFDLALDKCTETENVIPILHRCLSGIITNYITHFYWSNVTKSENIEHDIIKVLSSLWGFKSIEDNEKIAMKWLPGVLKHMGSILSSCTGWNISTIERQKIIRVKESSDFCLISILLSCTPPRKNILNWLFNLMHPTLDQATIIKSFASNDKTPEFEL